MEQFARRIAYEQTVELPESLITASDIREHVVGRVESIAPDENSSEHFRVELSYAPALSSFQLSQLLNLIYGNVSIFPGVRLLDLRLPTELMARIGGPGHGVDGVRRLLGVHGRPLLATALKPRGSSTESLVSIAHAFALGGGDIVKDDQNLVDDDLEGFKRRVGACFEAVERANALTGRRCLYFPHLTAPLSHLHKYLEFLHWLGVRGVLICPMVIGLETARACARDYGLVAMAHPAMTGSYTESDEQGIAHEILLGTLFRLAGADISIFPNFGGRFAFTRDQCMAIRERLLRPLPRMTAAFPCPAGGMQYRDLAGMSADYGAEAVFLVGASLLSHSDDLAASTEAFQAAIGRHFEARSDATQSTEPSNPERPGVDDATGSPRHLVFGDDFQWKGRPSTVYKDTADLPFRGIRRVELTGKYGEKGAFDLRYFEVAPWGFSSLEKHVHTHVIICARGRGILLAGDQTFHMKPMDIAYVGPLEVHQLRNESEEPFGFFCIVDRDRDRPMRP